MAALAASSPAARLPSLVVLLLLQVLRALLRSPTLPTLPLHHQVSPRRIVVSYTHRMCPDGIKGSSESGSAASPQSTGAADRTSARLAGAGLAGLLAVFAL
jgi:hypothetical protein